MPGRLKIAMLAGLLLAFAAVPARAGDGLLEHCQSREQLREELMKLPPEQREQKMEELRAEFKANAAERREKFDARWNKASPEERAKFCEKVKARCAAAQQDEVNGGAFACRIAEKRCGGKDGE
jgi:hypothetical protein